MANTVTGREAALVALVNHLRQVSPQIAHVYRHEPLSIYQSRMAAVTYEGDGEADGYPSMTMGHQMKALRVDIQVYWAWGSQDAGYLDDIEKEIIDMDRAIQAALSGERDLGGNISALMIGSSEVGYLVRNTDVGEVMIGRVLRLPTTLQILDAEAVRL